jgi:hypothetical protein
LFGASRYSIPRRDEVIGDISKLQNEINEKKTFLKQAENSIRDFIKGKIGYVRLKIMIGNASSEIRIA